MWYNVPMKIKAYAKVNLILNVLGTLPNGYHRVRTLMQAIDLFDTVIVEQSAQKAPLSPSDFEYGRADLGWKAAELMAESFGKSLDGIRVKVEKRIPAAAGLAGGSADAAAVMTGLAKLWGIEDPLDTLLSLGAKLGSDVPFCTASQFGHTAAIASGTGTDLEFVSPLDCAVELIFPEKSIDDKTRAVYAELKDADCQPVYSIEAFLAAKTLEEKRALMGNHLQAPAERLFRKYIPGWKPCEEAILSGAGPTYFRLKEEGPVRTLLK